MRLQCPRLIVMPIVGGRVVQPTPCALYHGNHRYHDTDYRRSTIAHLCKHDFSYEYDADF